ncbi:DoxX-like protein [Nocardioides albertanoniae]|uniref:DoxX-like protein n=1 Tax=Nocardioides albertanoniae TaxID=1175486 RepID=A0A543A836_9ACTN|nr:DoxX family protein [Nocardioides albertanoniae]TQL68646.1 DoxX-like protein [Nocardioides albertanoniae]
MFIAYIVVSSLLALACMASGAAKVARQPAMVEQLGGLGVAAKYVPVLGSLLLLGAVGLVVGNWIGALGIAAAGALALYFVGAIITHVRAGDAKGAVPTIALTVVSVAALVLRVLSL